ncbi:unnamed protein product [Aphis gossypii]|uniref:Uncharacterized protein n=1 Tax=Aphis gossypii TaxID=80765 RepID=A0A9P0J035_APHGO|nr:unnamed protein product [Aphis gossypii]
MLQYYRRRRESHYTNAYLCVCIVACTRELFSHDDTRLPPAVHGYCGRNPTRCTAPPCRRRRRTRLIIEPPETGVCADGYSIPSIFGGGGGEDGVKSSPGAVAQAAVYDCNYDDNNNNYSYDDDDDDGDVQIGGPT